MKIKVRLVASIMVSAFAFQFASCQTSSQDGASDLKFYGKDAKRAVLSFSHQVEMDVPGTYRGDVADIANAKWNAIMDEHIRLQLAHMFGAFVNHDRPTDFVKNPGIPRERPDIDISRVEKLRGNRVRIFYDYQDQAAFKKDLFSGRATTKISFYLPKDPAEVFSKGLISFEEAKRLHKDDEWTLKDIKAVQDQGEAGFNACTDSHYNSEGDFWYFWNPHNTGCPAETRRALEVVEASLKPLPSTTETWPRYKELYGDNGNGKKLLVTFLVGIDENWKKTDLGVQGFEKTFRLLTEGKLLLADPVANPPPPDAEDDPNAEQPEPYLLPGEIALLKATKDSDDVRFEVVEHKKNFRKMSLKRRGYEVELNMHLVNPDAESFVKLAVDGMLQSDVFMYDGHSGLGGYLSVGRLFGSRKKTLPKDKYQIFFFNGCSTFSYYNFDFFQLKADADEDPEGHKNLEILTTSVPATFTRGPGSDAWLLRGLFNGNKSKWQKIIDDIYRVDPDDSALTAVNGDEDKWNRQAP
jgi:hypothetical protein